jgi:predicted AAA+ superfamily ATPase
METLMKADIFFFVTTICVVLISGAIIYLLIRASAFMTSLRELADKLKEKAEDVGEEAEELLERMEDSFIFRLIFAGRKKKRKSNKKK